MKRALSTGKLVLRAEVVRTLNGPSLGRVLGGMRKQETVDAPPTVDTDTSVMGCVPTAPSEQH